MAQALTALGQDAILCETCSCVLRARLHCCYKVNKSAKSIPSAPTLERETATASAWAVIPTNWITRA